VIVTIVASPMVMSLMFRFPELLVLEAGAILLVARHMNFRLFEGWDPLQPRMMPVLPSLPEHKSPLPNLPALKD
jgi:hypothetical protein